MVPGLDISLVSPVNLISANYFIILKMLSVMCLKGYNGHDGIFDFPVSLNTLPPREPHRNHPFIPLVVNS